MRLHRRFLIALAVLVAVAATAAAAFGGTDRLQRDHRGHAKAASAKEKVKAKVKDGTLTVTGTNEDDALTLRLRAGDPTTLEVDAGDHASHGLAFDRSRFERIVVDAGGGDDGVRIDESNGAFTDTEATTLDGGSGNDTLVGGSFSETLVGGAGGDFVNGGRGADTAILGAGDDTFVWNPGDGSDIVEGQDGRDTMIFNGANANEKIDLSANGPRLRLFRDVANITMDTNGVETVDVNTLGGADQLTVHDLTGTDVSNVNTNLAATGGAGDGQPDQVTVEGTSGNDAISVVGSAGSATVKGLAEFVAITGAEAPGDTLAIHALDGDDAVEASRLAADAIGLSIDGGAGNDVLVGGAGNDVLAGGPGDDVLNGGPGLDTLDGGPGNNVLIQD
jgi:Ca2+-binding RTX toxin-like protein